MCTYSLLSVEPSEAILHIRPKLEYASVAWNSVTANDAGKLERILCFVISSSATCSTTTSVPEVT
jgi:hypothetical protein